MVAMKAPPGTLQLPLLLPECSWRPPSLGDLPSWAGAKRIAFDTETRDPHLKQLGSNARRPESYIVGFSFAIEDGPKHYVPIRHEGGDNVDVDQALAYLRHQAATFDGDLCGAKLDYDIDHCAEDGIEFKSVRYFRDIQIADPLINELEMYYSMKAIAERRGLPGKDESGLREAAAAFGVDPKSGMWRLPGRYVGLYGEQDAALPLQILRRQEREIEDQGLWDIYNLESRLLPVLVRMRRRGLRVNMDRLREVETWSLDQEAQALREVEHLSGVRIAVGDVWKPEPLARALAAIGYEVPKTAKGQPSVTADLLKAVDHPVALAIRSARKVNKLRTTFAASVRTHMVGDRLHPTFNQLRAAKDEGDDDGDSKGGRYGRLSSDHPNIQQQPARQDEDLVDGLGEYAVMWRSIYVPEEGEEFISCDYSQQEPRWLTHYAEITNQPRAHEAAQRYRDDPSTDNHQMMADLTGNMVKRKQAKELFLGKCYGMGGAKLCRKLNLPTRWAVFFRERGRETLHFDGDLAREDARQAAASEGGRAFEVAGAEGQAIIDTFDRELPYVSKLAKMCEKRAEKVGYIITVLGRRCRFPVAPDGSYDWCHKALNRLIQGSSADQTKRAVVEADAAGLPLNLQVHDEINMSGTREQARQLAEIMSSCVEATVPFKVDTEVGPSWGEAKGIV